jgi:hypothetical protein
MRRGLSGGDSTPAGGDDSDSHSSRPGLHHPQLLRRLLGYIHDPASNEGTPIVHRQRDGAPVIEVLDSESSTERESLVSAGELVHVVRLTRCSGPSMEWLTIPGCHPGLSPPRGHVSRVEQRGVGAPHQCASLKLGDGEQEDDQTKAGGKGHSTPYFRGTRGAMLFSPLAPQPQTISSGPTLPSSGLTTPRELAPGVSDPRFKR